MENGDCFNLPQVILTINHQELICIHLADDSQLSVRTLLLLVVQVEPGPSRTLPPVASRSEEMGVSRKARPDGRPLFVDETHQSGKALFSNKASKGTGSSTSTVTPATEVDTGHRNTVTPLLSIFIPTKGRCNVYLMHHRSWRVTLAT